MRKSEQHQLIKDLRYYESKMTRGDLELYGMFRKRDKDDEDLDSISQQKLSLLADKYIPRKSKKDLEDLWNKMTKNNSEVRDKDEV